MTEPFIVAESIGYNYATEQDVVWETPTTDEQARQLIPQYPSAQNLYRVYRTAGKTVLEAMANVLSVVVNEPAPFPLDKAQEDE